jgi:hypothetical protein
MSSNNINSALSQMKPKIGGKMPVQYKIQVNNIPPPQLKTIPTPANIHNLRQQVQHIMKTQNQPQKPRPQVLQSFGFQNQLSKIERMPNEKLNMLNLHFANKNIENDVYEFRINTFINNAKKGIILNSEFIKDADKQRVLNELKNYFYN